MVGVFLLEVPLYSMSALPFLSSTVKWFWLVECADEHQEGAFISKSAYQIAYQILPAYQI